MVSLGDCAPSSAGIATAVFIMSRREYMLPVSCILRRNIEVRQFQRGDLERILAIERHSFGRDAWNRKLFLHYFRQCPELFCVAKLGRRIAGYIITCAESRNAELAS